MIDFTYARRTNKGYNGANGNKIQVEYNDEKYMIKFPVVASKNEALDYTNGCISEYLGCHIFQLLGIPAQETVLGTYMVKDKIKTVVACKDFTSPGIVLQDFASMKNQSIDSARSGYGTELSDILFTFEDQRAFDPVELEEYFWDMFIVDAFIGNWDRHNGNWGFLYDQRADTLSFAPVFDCGSSLYPQADTNLQRRILADQKELDFRVFNIPTSAIKINGKKINYFDLISSLEYEGCNRALQRIQPRIDMNRINELIYSVPCISELEKDFYSTMLMQRKNRILDYSLDQLQKAYNIPEHIAQREETFNLNSEMRDARAASKALDDDSDSHNKFHDER